MDIDDYRKEIKRGDNKVTQTWTVHVTTAQRKQYFPVCASPPAVHESIHMHLPRITQYTTLTPSTLVPTRTHILLHAVGL